MYCGLKVLLWEAGRPACRPAGRVLEELELKPTQPPTVVGLGLGFGLSLAISTKEKYKVQRAKTERLKRSAIIEMQKLLNTEEARRKRNCK